MDLLERHSDILERDGETQCHQKMDLKFFNMLKSIEKLEKDHNFKSDSYNIATLKPKYPHNVLTVASPTGKAPPPSIGEKRFTKLSEAIDAASDMTINGITNSCSIVIHEGFYIDAFDIGKEPIDCGLKLEIIGVKNVRLILDRSMGIGVFESDLTLKNINIFDFRLNRITPTIAFMDGAQAEFLKVRINAPEALAIKLFSKSKLIMEESKIIECYEAFYSEDSDLRIKNSTLGGLITNEIGTNFITLVETAFVANNTSFLYCSSNVCLQFSKTKGTIENCIIKAVPKPSQSDPSDCIAISVYNSSSLTLKTSSISNFRQAAQASDFDSEIVAERCIISNCIMCFTFMFNSHGLIKNCKLFGDHAAVMANNVKGTVNYQKNRIRNRIASIVKDSKSMKPHHDFKYSMITGEESLMPENPSDKELSANTKRTHELFEAAAARGSRFYKKEPSLGQSKSCKKCLKIEMPTSGKMKYCIKCRSVCYCSKECQKADWGDHKLVCQS